VLSGSGFGARWPHRRHLTLDRFDEGSGAGSAGERHRRQLSSTVRLGFEEEREIQERLRNGELKLLYVSPERLFQQGFLDRMEELQVKLFAVDEAHCISSWGHSFRPEYQHLKVLKQRFPRIAGDRAHRHCGSHRARRHRS
jgi:hypothetical protein